METHRIIWPAIALLYLLFFIPVLRSKSSPHWKRQRYAQVWPHTMHACNKEKQTASRIFVRQICRNRHFSGTTMFTDTKGNTTKCVVCGPQGTEESAVQSWTRTHRTTWCFFFNNGMLHALYRHLVLLTESTTLLIFFSGHAQKLSPRGYAEHKHCRCGVGAVICPLLIYIFFLF